MPFRQDWRKSSEKLYYRHCKRWQTKSQTHSRRFLTGSFWSRKFEIQRLAPFCEVIPAAANAAFLRFNSDWRNIFRPVVAAVVEKLNSERRSTFASLETIFTRTAFE